MDKHYINRILTGLSVVLIAVILAGCNPTHKKHRRPPLLPSASGNPYEVMVVTEDSLWETMVGESIREILDAPVVGLPQYEPSFHTSHITESHYDRITNLFRNILIVKINDHLTQPKTSTEHNVHSYPQYIVTIQGPDPESLALYISQNADIIYRSIYADEINRMAMNLEDSFNYKFNKKAEELFGCNLLIPQDVIKMKEGKDFIWASNDGLETIQNICMYSVPTAGIELLTKEKFAAIRDSVMKINIPGDAPDRWMSTNASTLVTQDLNILGVYAMEVRGLWEMTNYPMGGPFIAHCSLDSINDRLVIVEGFVYAPSKMKRTMMRRLEAALYTLKLPSAIEKENEEQ